MTGKMWGKTPEEIAAMCKPSVDDTPMFGEDLSEEMPDWFAATILVVVGAILALALIGAGILVGRMF